MGPALGWPARCPASGFSASSLHQSPPDHPVLPTTAAAAAAVGGLVGTSRQPVALSRAWSLGAADGAWRRLCCHPGKTPSCCPNKIPQAWCLHANSWTLDSIESRNGPLSAKSGVWAGLPSSWRLQPFQLLRSCPLPLALGPFLRLQSRRGAPFFRLFLHVQGPVKMSGHLNDPGYHFKVTWLATVTPPLPCSPVWSQVWGKMLTSVREGHSAFHRGPWH